MTTLLAWPDGVAAAPEPTVALLTFASFTNFTRTTNALETVLTSPALDPSLTWDELIVSWNAMANVTLTVEARAQSDSEPVRWFNLGRWSGGPNLGLRTSVNGQRDDIGHVETDTLSLVKPAQKAVVRVTLRGPESGLKYLTVCFANARAVAAPRSTEKAAWGRIVDVPVRSQADYPEGVDKWCSPTSTTMLLAHWARELKQPELDLDVRVTAAGVFDPGWAGTGNWVFNTAFAGAQTGIRACVARFEDVTQLEAWTQRGIPVAASVSYGLLKGGSKPLPGDGHIVVVCGFTTEGDVVVNDPGVRRERVCRTFPRADFERAWERSHRTAYLVWPEAHAVPWPVGGR